MTMPRLISSNAGQDVDIVPASGRTLKINNSAAGVDTILDENNMVSDSATALATQQSIKAYVDNNIAGDNPTFQTVTFSPTTGGLVGTTTNDNANAGIVGELVASTISVAAGISHATATDITSISLTAGDWDVYGSVYFLTASTTVLLSCQSWISLISAALPASNDNVSRQDYGSTGVTNAGGGVQTGCPISPTRINVSATTTLYLSAFTAFTTSTCQTIGTISARRRR